MAVIDISDFRKGRNSSDDPLLLNPGNCVATSVNVWAPNGALQKIPGLTVFSVHSATASSIGQIFADSTVASASYNLYGRFDVHASATTFSLWGLNASANSWQALGYNVGTVSISGASLISATGSGTAWSTHASANDLFFVSGNRYNIASIEDDTHLTLSGPVGSAVATGTGYSIELQQGGSDPGLPMILNGSVWMGARNRYMQRFDGSAMTRIPSAPLSLCWAVFKNYAFSFGNTTAESRLQWSTIKDPSSWPVNNFIDIDKDKGKGQGLIAYGNELICFKTRGMYKVVGEVFDPSNPTYAVYPISTPPDFSFYATFSPTIHNGLLYFIAGNGIYVYSQGTNAIQRVSDGITADVPAPNFSKDGATINNTLQGYYGVSFGGMLIFMPLHRGNSTPSYCLVMDRAGAWWIAQDVTTVSGNTQFAGWPTVFPSSQTLLIPAAPVRVLRWDIENAYKNTTIAGSYVASADGSAAAISAQWRSKEFNIEYGHFKQLVLYLAKQSTGSLTVGWSVDQATFVTAAVDMTQGRGNLIRKTLDINQKGSTIQIKLLEESSATPFKVYAAKVYYDPILENRQA